MRKHFYMWLFFGLSMAIVVGVWSAVLAKTIRQSLSLEKPRAVGENKDFRGLELQIKNFLNVNKLLFEDQAVQAREELIQNAALQKIKERLESSTSTYPTN